MARRVFFSFHFQDDAMRAAQVRNSNVITTGTVDAHGFVDAAQWESIKRSSDQMIRNWINAQLRDPLPMGDPEFLEWRNRIYEQIKAEEREGCYDD